jgi:hypothetical protein
VKIARHPLYIFTSLKYSVGYDSWVFKNANMITHTEQFVGYRRSYEAAAAENDNFIHVRNLPEYSLIRMNDPFFALS